MICLSRVAATFYQPPAQAGGEVHEREQKRRRRESWAFSQSFRAYGARDPLIRVSPGSRRGLAECRRDAANDNSFFGLTFANLSLMSTMIQRRLPIGAEIISGGGAHVR